MLTFFECDMFIQSFTMRQHCSANYTVTAHSFTGSVSVVCQAA